MPGPWTFVDAVPDYEIRGSIMYITAPGWALCMPLHTFCAGLARSRRVIAEHLGHSAEIIAIPRPEQ